MRKIIDGKKYDTNTARVVGEWSFEPWSDYNYINETLYCKKTGENFLYGKGGARTEYAESAGNNNWSEGWNFIPYSLEEAKAWAMDHLSVDEYEDEFGEVEE